MEVAPLFLYLKSSKLHHDSLRTLRDAGYVPIAVESFEDVRVVNALSVTATDPIAQAAFATITSSYYDAPRTEFGKKVAKVLAGQQAA